MENQNIRMKLSLCSAAVTTGLAGVMHPKKGKVGEEIVLLVQYGEKRNLIFISFNGNAK